MTYCSTCHQGIQNKPITTTTLLPTDDVILDSPNNIHCGTKVVDFIVSSFQMRRVNSFSECFPRSPACDKKRRPASQSTLLRSKKRQMSFYTGLTSTLSSCSLGSRTILCASTFKKILLLSTMALKCSPQRSEHFGTFQ